METLSLQSLLSNRLWQDNVSFLCGVVNRLCFFKNEMTGFDLERLLWEAAKDVTPREKDKVSLIFVSCTKIKNIARVLGPSLSLSCCGCWEMKAFNSCPKGKTKFLCVVNAQRFNADH